LNANWTFSFILKNIYCKGFFGFKVQGSGFRVQGSGYRVPGSRFRVPGAGFRVQGSGYRVPGAGFKVQALALPPDKKTAGQIEKETDKHRSSNIEKCILLI